MANLRIKHRCRVIHTYAYGNSQFYTILTVAVDMMHIPFQFRSAEITDVYAALYMRRQRCSIWYDTSSMRISKWYPSTYSTVSIHTSYLRIISFLTVYRSISVKQYACMFNKWNKTKSNCYNITLCLPSRRPPYHIAAWLIYALSIVVEFYTYFEVYIMPMAIHGFTPF